MRQSQLQSFTQLKLDQSWQQHESHLFHCYGFAVSRGGRRAKRARVSELSATGERPITLRIYLFHPGASQVACLFAPALPVVAAWSVGGRRNAEMSWVSSVSQACSKKGQIKRSWSRKCWFVWIFFLFFFFGNNKKSSTSVMLDQRLGT